MGLFNWFFKRACYIVFDRVDANKNGTIEDIEVEIAILHLYNFVNKRLPGWQDPPDRNKVRAALKVFDTNADGVLQKDEFVEFAREMLKNGPDVFFSRLGKNALINTAVLPAVTVGIKQVAGGAGGPLGNIPGLVLAPAIGVVGRAVRGLLPF